MSGGSSHSGIWARDIRPSGTGFEGTFVRRAHSDSCGAFEPRMVRGTISPTGYEYSSGPEMVVKGPILDVLYNPKCQWTDKELGMDSINLKPVKQ